MTTHTIRTEGQRQQVLDFIARLDLSKPWSVGVKRKTKSRSPSQNNLMHKWFGIIAAETGNSIEGVKDFYRKEFLGQVIVEMGDKEHEVGRSTTTLSTAEMSAFMDQILGHATGELGIMLPLPEEMHLRGMKMSDSEAPKEQGE